MKKYFDNLRPFEKRVVVGVGVALFVLLNFWFVFPHFSDMPDLHVRIKDAQDQLQTYQAAITNIPFYEAQISALGSDGNTNVPSADRQSEFQKIIIEAQGKAGLLLSMGRGSSSTNNPYFLELSQAVTVQNADDKSMADFLYDLGVRPSTIYVKGLSLHPVQPTRYSLEGSVTLVASYQKPLPKGGLSTRKTKAAKTKSDD